MGLEKETLNQLRRFATAFRDARERGANESDTVMYLVKFFEEVLGYDSLKGEISKELAIKDRYCDVALKIDGTVALLVEAKAANQKGLVPKHIEQAENYASRAGVPWVLLTNGIEWKLFHLTFVESEGIAHDVAFEVDLIEELEKDADAAWARLSLLSKTAMKRGALDNYWSQKKVLSPESVVRALFNQDVLRAIRRELNRDAPARLDFDDVFFAVRETLSREALAAAGDLGVNKRRKRRRKPQKTDAATCVVTTDEDEDHDETGRAILPEPELLPAPAPGGLPQAEAGPKGSEILTR